MSWRWSSTELCRGAGPIGLRAALELALLGAKAPEELPLFFGVRVNALLGRAQGSGL